MKPTKTLVLSLLATLLGAGCVGSGPNTQQGAVGGALAGAVLGGVIGHNHGSRNTASGAAIGAAAGGLAGAAVGNNLDHQRGTVYTQPQPQTEYVVQQPPEMPPSPREVVTVRPAREAVWIEGYYAYVGPGRRYAWVPGHWEVPPPRYHTYVRPGWQRRDNGYIYVRGYWR